MTSAANITAHDFTLQDLTSGREVPLSTYAGKALLIVNVASACGLTPQYAILEALHRHYIDADLVVIGVPCNQFGGQEPGSPAEIQQFCAATYDVTFAMMRKVEVNGATAHPLFKWLTDNGNEPVSWNFAKFVIDTRGHLVGRFDPQLEPDEPELLAVIDAALGLADIVVAPDEADEADVAAEAAEAGSADDAAVVDD